MSVLHFKGKFVSQNSKTVFYEYYPEYISAAEVVGEFKIDIETWQWTITKESEPGTILIMPSDIRVVRSLTFKIKKLFEETNQFPKEVFWIS